MWPARVFWSRPNGSRSQKARAPEPNIPFSDDPLPYSWCIGLLRCGWSFPLSSEMANDTRLKTWQSEFTAISCQCPANSISQKSRKNTTPICRSRSVAYKSLMLASPVDKFVLGGSVLDDGSNNMAYSKACKSGRCVCEQAFDKFGDFCWSLASVQLFARRLKMLSQAATANPGR